MKALMILASAVFGLAAYAQTGMSNGSEQNVSYTEYESGAARGIHVALGTGIRNLNLRFDEANIDEVSGQLDSTVGLMVGYSHIPVGRIGFKGGLGLYRTRGELSGDGVDFDAEITEARFEGSATYGFNDTIYALAGAAFVSYNLNLQDQLPSSSINIDDSVSSTAGSGLQLGFGVQVSPNIGFEMRYALGLADTSVENEIGEDFDTIIQVDGLELNLIGTF